MNLYHGTHSHVQVPVTVVMADLEGSRFNPESNDETDDDDSNNDDDTWTETDVCPETMAEDPHRLSLIHRAAARAADQGLNLLVDVSAQAEARALTSKSFPGGLERQLREFRDKITRDQEFQSRRTKARSMFAKVILSENLKILERLAAYDETAAQLIAATNQNIDATSLILQQELWNAVPIDEIYMHTEQLADSAQAQFLSLNDRLQKFTGREFDRKLTLVLRRIRQLNEICNRFREAHQKRRDLCERFLAEATNQAAHQIAAASSAAQEDVAKLIDVEKGLMINEKLSEQMDEYVEKEVHTFMQNDIRLSTCESSLNALANTLETMAQREFSRLQALSKSESRTVKAYANGFIKFVTESDQMRAAIINNPAFEVQGEEGGEFNVSDRDRRASINTMPGRAPVQPASIRAHSTTLSMFSRGGSPISNSAYQPAASAFRPKDTSHIQIPSPFQTQTRSQQAKAQTETAVKAEQFLRTAAQEGPAPSALIQEVGGTLRDASTGGIPVPAGNQLTPFSVVSAAAQAAANATTGSYTSAPQRSHPQNFESFRCSTSTDQVTKIVCRCTFDGEPFEWYHMIYLSKNQRELEFPYSESQQLSVVLPDHLFVVDSICECMSTISETVVSLKSKKKSFFRALTNLGYAHKMQAKRMKKFQKQAWCATLLGTMEWIKRVRGFSTNTLHIEDLQLERLINFIETRAVPVLEYWRTVDRPGSWKF